MKRVLLAVGVCCALFAGHGLLLAQADEDADRAEGSSGATPDPAEQEAGDEYPEDKRRYGTSLDPVSRLNESLPKPDSLFDVSLPESVTDFKKGLYKKHGLKLGVSYQSLYQKTSETLTGTDTAWGGWFLINTSWTALNRGKDWQGKLVLALDGRHIINPGSNTAPGLLSLDTGSLWPTDGAFLEWDLYPAVFFWEQQVRKGSFAFRVGQQSAFSVLDPARFDEPRNAFTNSMVSLPLSVIPAGPPGLGVSAKWWPVQDSRLYVSGIVNDINAPDGEVDWSSLFDEGEIFAGLEVGYSWIREKKDFDHVHLTLWHADTVSTASWDSEPGWGFKVNGSKQWDRIAAFGNYAYNTAQGGGFGLTNSRQAVNAGAAYLFPFKIRGEAALAASWGDPTDEGLRSQSGLEAYWRILMISNLWFTPGVQYIVHPTFNPETDGFLIGQLKVSLFF